MERIKILNVGAGGVYENGDMIIINHNGKTVVCDMNKRKDRNGRETSAWKIIAEHARRECGIPIVDYLFVTHPDNDHIGDAENLEEAINKRCIVINKIITSPFNPESNPDFNEDEHPDVLGEVDHRHQGLAHLHEAIALGALRGVTRLMAGDGDARHRAAREVLTREVEVVVTWVVMVGEVPRDRFDAHTLAAVRVEHAAGDRRPARAARGHARPRLIRLVDIALGHQPQDERDHDDHEIQRIDAVAVSHAITIIEGHLNSFDRAGREPHMGTFIPANRPRKRLETGTAVTAARCVRLSP